MSPPALAELIERATGLAIERGGVSAALDRFVAERLRVLGLPRVEDYVALAADPAGPEQRRLIEAITVPHTWFYRDQEQLHAIAKLIAGTPPGPVAVWVAGCATGEEAYTLAMIGQRVGRDVSVLATDVNDTALAAARRGVYNAMAVRDVPARERRWLAERDGSFVVDPALRAHVTFARHNLVDQPPAAPRGAWDLVVCRNVLIYFSPVAAARLLQRFARSVREGGSLVVGASEVVFEPPAGLELVSAASRLVLRRTSRPAIGKPPKVRAVTASPVAAPSPSGALPASGTWSPPSAPNPPGAPNAPNPPGAPNGSAASGSWSAPGSSGASGSWAAPAEPAPAEPAAGEDLVTALTRGHALFDRGDHAAAIAVYTELSHRGAHGDVAEVWLFLGIARFVRGDIEAAAEALRSCLCLDSTLWPAGFFLARAYERLGRRAEARLTLAHAAVHELQPLALRSDSAVIHELRAFRHDFRNAARRLTTEPLPPIFK